jgi:hypothetical protein
VCSSDLIKSIKKVVDELKADQKREIKAADTAIRVEGYRLKRLLQEEIRNARPGGKRFAVLSKMRSMDQAHKKDGIRARSQALRRLAVSVRYGIPRKSPIIMAIGWVGPRYSTSPYQGFQGYRSEKWSRNTVLSGSWRRLAAFHQSGFTSNVTAVDNKFFAGRGGALQKFRGIDNRRASASKVFFLKKSTKTMKTPARPIIEPFWNAHESDVWRNIRSNYIRKLAGERI